jgi:hypothetical protein
MQVKDQTAGGTVLGTYDMSNGVVLPPGTNTATPTVQTTSTYAIPIAAPAGHVIRVTKTDAGSVAAHIDVLLPQSDDPPMVVLVKEMHLPNHNGGGVDYRHGPIQSSTPTIRASSTPLRLASSSGP